MPITPDSSLHTSKYSTITPVSASSSETSVPGFPTMSCSSFESDLTDDVDSFVKSQSQRGSIDAKTDNVVASSSLPQAQVQQDVQIAENSRPKPNQQNGLLSLLSGHQSSKKKAKKPLRVEDKENMLEIETDCDITENFDTSFTEIKSKHFQQDHDLLELERKIYKTEAGSVSAKDLLSRLKKPIEEPRKVKEEIIDDISDTSIEVIEEPTIISAGDSKDILIDTKTLESKIYGHKAKVTSAKDFLQSLRPIPKKDTIKNRKEARSRFVTLKITSEALAEIKRYDNPFKTRGNLTFQGTISSDQGSTRSTEFFTPRVKNTSSSSSSSFSEALFDSMMSASKNTVKLTPLQKLKELEPPIVQKSEFHVYLPDNLTHHNQTINALQPKEMPYNELTMSTDCSVILPFATNPVQRYYTTQTSDLSKDELLDNKIPHFRESPQLKSIVDRFFYSTNFESLVWPNLFQPDGTDDLMLDQSPKASLKNWVRNSFARLKAQSLKNPRNVLLKQKKKKLQKSLDNFIVDDTALVDDEETEEEIFVPLLILQGSVGSCKSSSIYTVMKDLQGYVHEINTGVNRGRKDIYSSLKEFSTTHLVHQQKETKTFQQGIVLLEDVDIMFEQDKNFWLMVQDILNISRRPMVLTCESLQNIPKSLLDLVTEEDSIINLDLSSILKDQVKNYLWVCALSQGFDINDLLLDTILSDCFNGSHYDIRKCLMQCQFVCQACSPTSVEISDLTNECIEVIPPVGVVHVSISEPKPKSDVQDLESYESFAELISASDILDSNIKSLINHLVQENELIDIYLIDDSTQLKQPTLPFELNIGSHIIRSITEQTNMFTSSPEDFLNFNIARTDVNLFVGSRSKKTSKLIQDLVSVTRSTRSLNTPEIYGTPEPSYSWTPEPTGIPDTSFLNYITPSPFVLELLPFCRLWYRFQLAINEYEKMVRENGSESFKAFLNYRDFQYESAILLNSLNYEKLALWIQSS